MTSSEAVRDVTAKLTFLGRSEVCRAKACNGQDRE
jgi:hypothetical protein